MAANRLRLDIPVGRKCAISRDELTRVWQCPEREVRRTIATLRYHDGGDGYAILSTASEPAGYWRSNDPDEIRQFIRETTSRARNTFASLHDARRVLKKLDEGA